MVMVASGLSTPGANTKTADLIGGQYQYLGKGIVRLFAKGSAAGINASLAVNGIALVNDLPIVYTGTAGTISQKDHIMCEQLVSGGRVELYLRNTTGTAGTTCDYIVTFDPVR